MGIFDRKITKISYIIKIALAIVLLFCLAKMPYGYYQFVRFLALIGFAFLAYEVKEHENKRMFLVYIILAFLFQPFFKIALGRELWNIIDALVAIFLLLSIFFKYDNDKLTIKPDAKR